MNSCCIFDLKASGIGLVFTKSEFVELFISSLSLTIHDKVYRSQSSLNSVFQCLSTKKFYSKLFNTSSYRALLNATSSK